MSGDKQYKIITEKKSGQSRDEAMSRGIKGKKTELFEECGGGQKNPKKKKKKRFPAIQIKKRRQSWERK